MNCPYCKNRITIFGVLYASYIMPIILKLRMRKLLRIWNKEAMNIEGIKDKDILYGMATHILVWQELRMWVWKGEQIKCQEFLFICERRGFPDTVVYWLKSVLLRIGIGECFRPAKGYHIVENYDAFHREGE